MLIQKGGDGGGALELSAPGRETVFSFETRAPNLCCIIATQLDTRCDNLSHYYILCQA